MGYCHNNYLKYVPLKGLRIYAWTRIEGQDETANSGFPWVGWMTFY